MIDVTEILEHWYAGRPKVEVARSLGVDAKTVRRYVAPAEAAGMAPGGPPVTPEQWRALARQWFPQAAGAGVRQVSWREIAVHHDRIAALVGVVPVSVIHQRLADEAGLEASVASVRRYVRAHFPAGARAGPNWGCARVRGAGVASRGRTARDVSPAARSGLTPPVGCHRGRGWPVLR